MKTFLALIATLAAAPAFAGSTSATFLVTARVVNACTISQPPSVTFDNLDSAKGGTSQSSAGITCTKGATASVRLNGPMELTDGKGNTLPYTVTDTAGQPINATSGPSFTSATALAATMVPMTAHIARGNRVPDGDYSGSVLMTVDF